MDGRGVVLVRRMLLVLGVIFLASAVAAPVVAQKVVEYARNADKVDGRDAVASHVSRKDRAGELVATNRGGRLPGDIVRKVHAASTADRLGHLTPGAFLQGCQPGSLRGQAQVAADVGPVWERVPGFRTTYGGPFNPETGTACHFHVAIARRHSPGTYDVQLASIAWSCGDPLPPDVVTVVVSVQSTEPLVATYEPVCESGVYVRVRITDLQGVPTDAPFSVALLDENGYPIP